MRGVGRSLLEALIAASEAAGYWTLLAGVLAENAGSLRSTSGSGSGGSASNVGSARMPAAAGGTSSCSNAGVTSLASH